MTDNEKKAYLSQVYRRACAADLCLTKSEFAKLVGVDRGTLSTAMNKGGRCLTDSLVSKVRMWAKVNGLEDAAPEEPKPQRSITIPEETLQLYTNLSETCRNLSAILAQYQAAGVIPAGTQKIFQTKP